MNPIAISSIVFAFVFGGALLGMFPRVAVGSFRAASSCRPHESGVADTRRSFARLRQAFPMTSPSL
jgi:hypothetical protein